MKLTFSRTSVLLALALGLSACGGDKATFELGGPVTGLVYPGLVLTNVINGDAVTVTPPATAGAVVNFKLGKTLEYGQTYDVQITSAPEHQNCALGGGKDTAGRLASISIRVDCQVQVFNIGGTVSGLKETGNTTLTGLVLGNGPDRLAIEKNAVYVMPLQIQYGASYGVYVLTQPTGQTCTVANASGKVNTVQLSVGYVDPVNNINVTCVNNP
jgi:hypothetical protein